MKDIELIVLVCWLGLILIYQFHGPSAAIIRKYDLFGIVPSFHLFSPKPFLGRYVLYYRIVNRTNANELADELVYDDHYNFLASSRRTVKCINTLCTYFPKSSVSNPNYQLLLGCIKNDCYKKKYQGNVRFYIYLRLNTKEKLLFKSRVHDL